MKKIFRRKSHWVVAFTFVLSLEVSGQIFRPHGCPAPVTWRSSFSFGEEIPETGDFNGDGLDDVITFYRSEYGGASNGDAFVALNEGGSFGVQSLWHPFFGINSETLRIGDFNGDGRDDIATFLHGTSGVVYVALSNGSSFNSSRIWARDFAEQKGVPYVGDFDGDGRDDILSFEPTTGEVRVALSNGVSAFVSDGVWVEEFEADVVATGDFDGDGIDDLCGVSSINVLFGDVEVALSDGEQFEREERWALSVPFDGFTNVMVGQFNGYGGEDLALLSRPGALWVLPSEGDEFEWDPGDSVWQPKLRLVGEIARAGKFNRDLNEDFAVFVSGGNNGDVKVSLTGGHAQEDPIDPVVFGYDTLGRSVFPPVAERPALQTVPMVLGLFSFSDKAEMGAEFGRDRAFYESFFFGPGKPNVIDWFSEISRGRFTFERAGVGVYEIDLGEEPDEDARPASVQALADAGFDFREYDDDGDGVIRADELCIAAVFNNGNGGGQNWPAYLTVEYETGGNIRLETRYAGTADLARLDLYVHELAHHFEMRDLYSSRSINDDATLGHANVAFGTWDPNPLTRWDGLESDLLYLDGWHGLRFGWSRPKIYNLDHGPGFASLAAPQNRAAENRGVILYDGSHGTSQYYLMEFRSPMYQLGEQIWSNQDEVAFRRPDFPQGNPFAGYDSNVEKAGIYPWFVKMESQNRRVTELVGIGPGGDGVLDSTVLFDDVIVDGVIRPGSDTVMQSTVNVRHIKQGDNKVFDSILAGDDIFSDDRILVGLNGVFDTVVREDDKIEGADKRIVDELVFLANDPDDHDERGKTDHVITDGQLADFQWRSLAGKFQTGANVGPNSGQIVWGDPFRPFIESWPTTPVKAGSAITVQGQMGPYVGSYSPTLQCEETGQRDRLTRLAWGTGLCIWEIPDFVPPGKYLLYVRQSNDSYDTTVSNTVSIEVEDTWQLWLDVHFSPAEQNDPAISGGEVDLDGDGIPNLGEWLSGGNPKVEDPHLKPTYEVDETHAYIYYPRLKNPSGGRVVCQASSDLDRWYSTGGAVVEEDYLGIPGLQLYRASNRLIEETFFRLAYVRWER